LDRVRRLTLVAVFAVQLAGAAVILAPVSAAYAAGPLPNCRYDDILTPRREYNQWEQSLLDPIYMLPKAYFPGDLAGVGQANVSGTGKVRRLVLDDLRAMSRAASDAGKPIAVHSAFRSYAGQKSLFNSYVRKYGFRDAALISARPGHSEHQLGTTIDFKSRGGSAPWNGGDWGKTGPGNWMKQNGWQYGWIMSYPKGELSTTCYRYEPWHYRYFGRDVARQIHQSGLTSREWLWRQGYGEGR
jgi:D-alanyl-D-alanine carboxypeptidase